MKILRAADHRVMPWKNGGGSTTEIAVFPEGSGLDAFDWRVSMASVAADGPFSMFPGIDRTLIVLSGDGIVLNIEGRDPVRLTAVDMPLAFPGDVPTRSVLIGCPIIDLNVMSRRTRFSHRVVRHRLRDVVTVKTQGAVTLIISRSPGVELSADNEQVRIDFNDAAMIEGSGHALSLKSATGEVADVFVVSFAAVVA
jgi:environmental stress-induced protein Ves